ncbi:MAG: DUF4491 family protein [Bacteroidales bacterium]|nr:DUF4491 family protein [Bacteroidales bacterium]
MVDFSNLTLEGLVVGFATFLCIGLFHPLVIKAEYYWGVGCWWLFALGGVVCCVLSLVVSNLIISVILGVVACSFFWSIGELFKQRKRVERGWFPRNPKRNK